MLTPDTVLQNRYHILRHIGGGGMGLVYLAEDNRLPGRTCAVKEMSPDQLPPDDRTWATNAFRQEAQMLARLNHSGLTSVTDFFPEEGNLYLVMDYVEGETLAEMLESAPNERLPQGQVLNVVRQLCDVLEYLHRQNPPVIFRDLKPSNVMLTPEGQVKLIDFGIARLFKPTKSQDTVTLGTPGYAAPEQWGTAGQSDDRSDIYGLGVLLLRLTTGYDPTPNPFPLPQPRAVMPEISPKIEYLILRATPAQPSARYQNIAEFRHDMDTPSERLKPQEKTKVLTASGSPPATPPAPAAYSTPYPPQATPYPQPAPAPKRTGLWIGMGIGGVLLIGLCAAVLGGALAMPAIFGAPTTRPPTIEQVTAPPGSPVPPSSEQPPTPTTEISGPTQETVTLVNTPWPTDTPYPTQASTSVDVALCTKSDFDGSKCRSTGTVFPSNTEAMYATWQLSDALARRTEFTRRWYKDGKLLLETSNFAGENARWTPSDGHSYYVYLSATEGTGKRLFNSGSLPTGSYKIELFVDGSLADTIEFVLQ